MNIYIHNTYEEWKKKKNSTKCRNKDTQIFIERVCVKKKGYKLVYTRSGYIETHIYTHTYIYIYIEREREWEKSTCLLILYVCMCRESEASACTNKYIHEMEW